MFRAKRNDRLRGRLPRIPHTPSSRTFRGLRAALLVLALCTPSTVLALGADWYPATHPQAGIWEDAYATHGGYVYRIGIYNPLKCIRTQDGSRWEQVALSTSMGNVDPRVALSYGGNFYVIGNNMSGLGYNVEVWRTSNMSSYTRLVLNAFERKDYAVCVHAGKMIVTGGEYFSPVAAVLQSTDGATWSVLTASPAFPARCRHTSVSFNGRIYVIGGYDGTFLLDDVWSSADGNSWTQDTGTAAFGPRSNHQSCVYDGKMWVVGGFAGAERKDVWYSTNGSTWVAANMTPPFMERSAISHKYGLAALGTAMYVLGPDDVWKSSDGVNWIDTLPNPMFPHRDMHSSVVYNNRLWIIGGTLRSVGSSVDRNDVWSSDDGSTWTCATTNAAFSVRSGHRSCAFDGKMWVVGGGLGAAGAEVWHSTNGTVWTSATLDAGFARRGAHTLLVKDGRMWVIGGLRTTDSTPLNDVWYSDNGTTWTQATPAAEFPARAGHESCVYQGKMWVIAGAGNAGYLNDVWCSTDGTSWTRVTSAAAFSRRVSHAVVATGGKIWLMGGEDTTGHSTYDVWSSPNGVTWTRATQYAWPKPRAGMTADIFRNRVYLVGGYHYDYDLIAEAWYSTMVGDINTSPTGTVVCGPIGVKEGPAPPKTIEVQNVGDATLQFTGAGIDLTGADMSEFCFASPPDISDLPAGEKRVVQVLFDPSSTGTKTAAVRVTTNDPDETTVTVPLSGLVLDPADISVAVTGIDFVDMHVAEGATESWPVKIVNTGPSRLTFTGPQVALVGPGAASFAIASDSGENPLLAGTTRTLGLTFDPAANEESTAVLRITSDDDDEPVLEVTLVGQGVTPNGFQRWLVPAGDPLPLVSAVECEFRADFTVNPTPGILCVSLYETPPYNLANAIPKYYRVSYALSDGFQVIPRFYFPWPESYLAGLKIDTLRPMKSTDGGYNWTMVPPVLNVAAYWLETSSPQTSLSLWALVGDPITEVSDWSLY